MPIPTPGAAPTTPSAPPMARIHRLVPFVHVADVEASLTFYALFGFGAEHVLREPNGRAYWAMAAASPTARIMFARASGPVVPEQQAVLFYLYTQDVRALRAHLLSHGVHDGGRYCGQAGPNNGRRVVFDITHPDYMTEGEVRVADPDGYCILVGQCD